MAHFFLQTPLVDRPNLFEQDDRVLRQPAVRLHGYVRRQTRFAGLARNCGGDHSRAVFVPDVILNDENGPHPALLASDDRREVGVVDIASSDANIHDQHALSIVYSFAFSFASRI